MRRMPASESTFLRTFLACLLVTLAVLAGGCSRDTDGQLPAASGEAIKALRKTVKGFALIGSYPDTFDGQYAIALEFSRPLVGTQDFDSLLPVTDDKGAVVSGSWVLDEEAKILRFPNVQPNRDYVVNVPATLAAADGKFLPKALKLDVHTGPLEPVVGFASQGSVLPARESRGLPVVSVNVSEVDVEFLRVREKELPKFFAEFQRGGRRGSWDLNRDYDGRKPLEKLADPVYVNRFVLGGKPNERVLTYLPLQDIKELQEPGLYFAVMKRAGAFQDEFETAFFTVSDLGVHARAYHDALFVHVASLESGEAVGDTELRVLNADGEAVYKAETDGNGNALLKYRMDAAHVLVARRGRDVSMLPFNQPALDLSEFAVAGREEAWFDVFAWSGRDLYRPGETARLSALLRDHDGRPLPASQAKQPLFVRYVQPDGKTLLESRLQPDAQGYASHAFAIPADAATGRWRVEFRTDPASKEAVQGMTLRVEEFLPERMKLELDAPAHPVIGRPLTLQVQGDYLYGAPAAGNRVTAKLAVELEKHPVESLPNHFFGDDTYALPHQANDVLDATLDERGHLEQDIPLPQEVKPVSPIAALVSASLYETGGRTINRTLKRVMLPADAMVGVRPLFTPEDGSDANANAAFEIIRVAANGAPRPAKGLRVSLVREHRDYHWNHDEDEGWSYDYTSRFETIETKTVDAGQNAERVAFPVEWGEYRLEVFDPSTKLTTRFSFFAGWSWNDENRGLDARPDKVKVSLDKTRYRAGDTLEVTVTPPHPGKGLLMVESDRMLYVQAIDAKPGKTFSIPVTQDWERHDVYVTALVFRGGSASSKVTPARAVGVVHVPMERGNRRVAVGLAAPKMVRPERPLPVVVSAPKLAGKLAFVTVSAVDVGILNITRFPVPDPATHFFAQRRLGVDSYDVYGRVIESFEGEMARIRFGGDAALEALPQARRPTSRVQTVDLFSGPVRMDAKGLARVKLDVPDFNGTLRVSTVVYSGGVYGFQSRETVVRAPVLAEASLPRVLAPGDRSNVTLDVQNFTGRAGTFDVNVLGAGPLGVEEGHRRVTLAPEAKQTLTFPLLAKEGYSTAKVRVQVEGNGYKVDRSYDLPVRPGWGQVVRSRGIAMQDEGPVAFDASLADGLMPASISARMTVSPTPPLPFASALEDLLKYPYGCAEQTTSKGYATLVYDPATAAALGLKPMDAARRARRMEGAFGRLASMQIGSGHFSMWGDGDYLAVGLTPYIAEFLLDARQGGFAVPDAVLQKALSRLNEDLLTGGESFYGNDYRDHLKFAYQAYAGYVLARVNRAPLGTLRALYDNDRKKALTGLPLVHLGVALALQGDTARGKRAIAEGFAKSPELRPRYLWDYGSRLRDDALMITLVRTHHLSTPATDSRVLALSRELDVRRRTGALYLSTQEQVALIRLARSMGADRTRTIAGKWKFGDSVIEVPAAPMASRLFDAGMLSRGVRFEPAAKPPVYASLDVAGIPRTAPKFDESQIRVVRSYFTTDGSEWKGGTLEEGDALIVKLDITAHESVPDALLTDLLPAGLEVENFNLGDEKQWADVAIDGVSLQDRSDAAEVRHEEFRDDRYVAALNLGDGSTARVFYLVRAVTPGRYTVPPPLVEDMYRPDIRGVGRATIDTLVVKQPGR